MAQDMYVFLQGFYQLYPQYKNLPFYITGESYGKKEKGKRKGAKQKF